MWYAPFIPTSGHNARCYRPNLVAGLSLLATTGASSMACFMCCGSGVPGTTCMKDTESGTRTMSGSSAGPNKASGMPSCRRWSTWDRRATAYTLSTAPAFAATPWRRPEKRGRVRTLLLDQAAALRKNPWPLLQSGTASRLHPDRRRNIRLHHTAAVPLLEIPIAAPKALVTGEGFDSDRFRESLLIRGILPFIPPRSKRKLPEHPNYRRY